MRRHPVWFLAFGVDIMAAKEETGGRDGAGQPAHQDQLSSSASAEPNTAQHLSDVTYREDALPPEVSEVRLTLTRSSQCY